MSHPRHDHDDPHDRGLQHDMKRLATLEQRRGFLRVFAGLSLVPLAGCAANIMMPGEDGDIDLDATSDAATGDASTSGGTCAQIPEETGGPYPGDGTNGPNVLNQSGIVRSDIRASFGSMSGTAAGVPLTIELTFLNVNASCAPIQGLAIYLWHCDQGGNYSLYGSVTDKNYLRGVQETDANGKVSFTSIFPACYSGRWPHIHFEIFRSLAMAMAGSGKLRTSQLALPKASCDEVFATAGYESSVRNLAMTSLTSDMVFGDGSTLQVGAVTGDTTSGYTVKLNVGVAG